MIGFFRRKKPQDGPDAAQTRPSTEELAAAFPRAPGEALPADTNPASDRAADAPSQRGGGPVSGRAHPGAKPGHCHGAAVHGVGQPSSSGGGGICLLGKNEGANNATQTQK